MMKTSPSREEWRQTVEVYTAHQYTDFFLGYQRGWVSFVSHLQPAQQVAMCEFAYLDRDRAKCAAYKNDLENEADPWVLATWKIPKLLVEVGEELAAKQSETRPLPGITNRVLLLPHVPIEFLDSIATFREKSVTQLGSLLIPGSSVQVSCEPRMIDMEPRDSNVTESGRVFEEGAVCSELNFAEKHFSTAARSAWMLTYAHAYYSKQLPGLRTNYEYRSAELAAFLQGHREPLPFKKDVTSLTKELAKHASLKTGADVLPLLKRAEMTDAPSLGDILRAVAPVDPNIPKIKNRDEPPDVYLLKLILEKSIYKPPLPSQSSEWLGEIYQELNAVDFAPESDDESMNQTWARYLVIAKGALASPDISSRDLLADYGRQYPAMCATVLYYKSQELNDFEKLKTRLKSFNPPPSVRWLSYSLFGAWNGFQSKQLLSLLSVDMGTPKEIFVRAFTLLVARKYNVQKPDLSKPSLEVEMHIARGTQGGETLVASIGGIALLKFRLAESHIDISRNFRSIVMSTYKDLAVKEKIDESLEKLALTSIPQVKCLLDCEFKGESKESQMSYRQGKFSRKGPFKDSWSVPEEHWGKFTESINEKWFINHVRLHEQAFAQFMQKHGSVLIDD